MIAGKACPNGCVGVEQQPRHRRHRQTDGNGADVQVVNRSAAPDARRSRCSALRPRSGTMQVNGSWRGDRGAENDAARSTQSRRSPAAGHDPLSGQTCLPRCRPARFPPSAARLSGVERPVVCDSRSCVHDIREFCSNCEIVDIARPKSAFHGYMAKGRSARPRNRLSQYCETHPVYGLTADVERNVARWPPGIGSSGVRFEQPNCSSAEQ